MTGQSCHGRAARLKSEGSHQALIRPGSSQMDTIDMSSYEFFGRAIHEDVASIPSSQPESSSLRRLSILAAYEAALAVASEVRIETLLQRIVEMSRSVAHAKIAALQQLGATGEAGPFIHAFDADADHAVVEIEQALDQIFTSMPPITSAVTLPRLSLLSDISPENQDLANLPALIVPVLSGNLQVGSLVLLGREDNGSFDGNDLDAIKLLAEHAAAAIDRARMYGLAEMRNANAREQLLQLRQVLDNLPAGVIVVQAPDAWIQMANNTAADMIYGTSANRASIPVVYRDFGWLGPDGQELPRLGHPGILALRGERLENRQLTLVNSGGDKIPVLVQAAPILTHENDIMGAVVVFQDFSSLRAAEQIKDDFLSLISHEFRTPLTAIHGGALLLHQQWDDLDEETRHELLDDIGTESSRLDRMLGNLLSVAEIMAGRFLGETEPIVIEPLVQDLIDEFNERTPTHQLTWQADEKLPLAEGDPAWLSQIMRNLYENAVKYSPEGGEIRTIARRVGDHVNISVTDSGLGILPDHVPHVFERFRRPGADPTVRGMGLGLYLSRLLVDAMGGNVHAESDGPGTGSTFTVELPIVREWDRES